MISLDSNATDLVHYLDMGGIEFGFPIDKEDLPKAIERLTTCHDHVFAVDQARGDFVVIVVSRNGLKCLRETEGITEL